MVQAASGSIGIEGVSKSYGDTLAVASLDLAIRPGEFFSLLGPSGCGKTTTLRMIAGFEAPDAGRISIDDEDVTFIPPHRRDTGMVFQNYALFPHRTVAENVGFGLRMRQVETVEIERRVARALDMVELKGLGGRFPHELSGGQQQRVALARVIVIEPRVLLMDEPLGALDKQLRQAMQFELKELQQAVGITLVYVTHDQEEALTMSDRIAVMNDGRLEQLASPETLYEQPRTAFVARFIGESNLLEGVADADGTSLQTSAGECVVLPEPRPAGTRLALVLRPEHLAPAADGGLEVEVREVAFAGSSTLVKLTSAGGQELLWRAPANLARPKPGERLRLGWPARKAVILDEAA